MPADTTWFNVVIAHAGRVAHWLSPGVLPGHALAQVKRALPAAELLAMGPAPASAVPLGDAVGRAKAMHRGDLGENVPPGRRPSGVIASLRDGAIEVGPALAAGWCAHPGGDATPVVLEATVDDPVELFLTTLERLPCADNLEVEICDHFDGAISAETWLSPRLDVKRALRFLDDHGVDLLMSGHVQLAIYLRAQRATLRLTDHKSVVWLAATEDHRAAVIQGFERAGAAPAARLVHLGHGPHFHYRGGASRDLVNLRQRLSRARLRAMPPTR